MGKLRYTNLKGPANPIITLVIFLFRSLAKLSELLGYQIRLTTESGELELYYHDDYPNIILVDKSR